MANNGKTMRKQKIVLLIFLETESSTEIIKKKMYLKNVRSARCRHSSGGFCLFTG